MEETSNKKAKYKIFVAKMKYSFQWLDQYTWKSLTACSQNILFLTNIGCKNERDCQLVSDTDSDTAH